MKTLTLVLTTTILFGVTTAMIEWPVFFEHLGFVHSIHNKWDITVSVKLHLPSLQARLSKTIHRLRLLDHQYEVHESEEKPVTTTSRNQDLSRIEELHESWARLNRHLVYRAQNLQRRSEDLRHLGRPNMKRKKRQDDGGAVGGILKTLFGVAYTSEVSGVASKVDALDNRLSGDIRSVSSFQDDLQSRNNVQFQKHEAMLGEVEKMTNTLERKVKDMETNPILKTELGEIVHSRNEQYQSLQLELDLMEERLGEIERVVISLSAGKLSKDILPPKQLGQTLNNVERQLPENYTLLFPSEEPLWPYYSVLTATANFDTDLETAVVQVGVPLVDLGNILELHRVHNLPLKVKEGYSVTADIATDYLITDSTRSYFLELNKEDFQDCQVYHNGVRGQHFYCGLKPMLRGDEARSCVMQLYQGQSDPTWCQSRLRHGLVQPFQRLYNGSWIFSALHEQLHVQIACPDGTDMDKPLSGFGVIGMAEGCTVTSKDFRYPHTFTGSITLSLSFGDKGWDTAEYLAEVPLNETLFHQNPEAHVHEELDSDAFVSFNDIDQSQGYFPQLIEAIESDVNDEYAGQDDGRSSTTVLTPNSIIPTASTEEIINENTDHPESNLVEDEASPIEAGENLRNTPLFLFLTPATTPSNVFEGNEGDLNSSVQSGVLNVEDVAANKDDTTVKYDLLIKLAEKIKSNNWLSLK